jgi:hypothetical protein
MSAGRENQRLGQTNAALRNLFEEFTAAPTIFRLAVHHGFVTFREGFLHAFTNNRWQIPCLTAFLKSCEQID